ncbi:Ger(x)C family spore germination protein [Desulfotruncus alcoholivorax]|uniref:Ger(x)C family spore germination protein n=1 Tax=Desulfotruncus alcoholivorax TaxID=265477 RepID=UPI00048965E8|nr:Ger(x)C family spore germination protein [Desulfotruncus alcoholivorax]
MIKKIIGLCLAICLALPLGGCWSRKELNELTIVLAAGVDRAPGGNILLTVQIARPKSFSGGTKKSSGFQENNIWVISQTGETVMDAARYLETKVSRKLYWSHAVILVFGEQLAAQGLRQAINFFSRSPEFRETTWVFVARGKASDVINSHSQLESTSAQSVGNMARSGAGFPVKLKDLSMMLASYGTNPVLPRIELTPSGNPQGPGMQENIPEADGDNQKATQTHAEVTVTGTGVFKDDKLAGWLNLMETRGLLWLRNKMEQGEITINSLKDPGKHISVRVTGAKTKVEPFYDGNNVWFDVKIKMEGDLLEQQSSEKLTESKNYREIEQRVAKEIEQKTRNALDKAQHTYGVDIFSFGQAFHRKYKKDWPAMRNRWNEIFSEAGVSIQVEAKISKTGLTTNRLSIKK